MKGEKKMNANLFEIVFQVTETCQNGNERTKKVSVFSKRFKNGVFYTESARNKDAIEILKAYHYYNIKYIETKAIRRFVI